MKRRSILASLGLLFSRGRGQGASQGPHHGFQQPDAKNSLISFAGAMSVRSTFCEMAMRLSSSISATAAFSITRAKSE